MVKRLLACGGKSGISPHGDRGLLTIGPEGALSRFLRRFGALVEDRWNKNRTTLMVTERADRTPPDSTAALQINSFQNEGTDVSEGSNHDGLQFHCDGRYRPR